MVSMNKQALTVSYLFMAIVAILFNWLLFTLLGSSAIMAPFWSGLFIFFIYRRHLMVVLTPRIVIVQSYRKMAEKNSPYFLKVVASTMATFILLTMGVLFAMTPLYISVMVGIAYTLSFIKICGVIKEVI